MDLGLFRPWGLLPWILDKLPPSEWSVLACLSTEERCLTTWQLVSSRYKLFNTSFLLVKDPLSRFSSVAESRQDERRRELENLGGNLSTIEEHQLFERTDSLVKSVKSFIQHSTENIIVDISSFPKRFFFPIIKLVMEATEVKNLIVTYTIPERYFNGPLSEDPEHWRNIPLFAPPYPEPQPDVFVVGVGFELLGLPELLGDDYHNVAIKLLFPFPPGPPLFQRAWEFVRSIESSLPHPARQPVSIDAHDVSETFNHICSTTQNGSRYAVFAPYGPKPMSLAMCIYATLAGSAVYYTQPKVYNPYYSVGVAEVGGVPETYAYCLRLGGNSLYSL